MPFEYATEISELKKELSFIKKVVLIEEETSILFSSDNWNVSNDLGQITSSWNSREIHSIKISGVKYIIKTWTPNRLIASAGKDGHLIGVKEDKWMILVQIEPDGIIPFTTMELSRFLDSIKIDESYTHRKGKSRQKWGKKEENEKTSPKQREQHKRETEDKESTVPFTAQLMAHYRAQESKKESPLIMDPLAARLAGDLESYFKKHKRYSEMDYPIIRSLYVEQNLIANWCKIHKKTQIVMLGAGLSTRAYRFEPFKSHNHEIFEIDLPEIIHYKEEKLTDKTPLTKLKRISADLSRSKWVNLLKEEGFSPDVLTFWTMEGLLYYLEKESVTALLKQITTLSKKRSKLFLDLLQRSRWLKSEKPLFKDSTKSFTKHFKWGIDIKEVPSLFSGLGWDLTCSFADKYDQGRDVGQNTMIFVDGILIK